MEIQDSSEKKESTPSLLCSITLEPISIAGITHTGSVYDFEAITSWVKDNDTDPLTGLYLPSTLPGVAH